MWLPPPPPASSLSTGVRCDSSTFSPDENSAWDRKLVSKYQSCLGWVLFLFSKVYFGRAGQLMRGHAQAREWG